MLKVKPYTFWFVTGSQHLYGEEALTQVKKHSEDMVRQMNATGKLANEIVFKDVLTNAEDIVRLMHAANADEYCAGVITWIDRKSTRLNSSHVASSYAVFCLKKKSRKYTPDT